jgi:hypothetical protein
MKRLLLLLALTTPAHAERPRARLTPPAGQGRWHRPRLGPQPGHRRPRRPPGDSQQAWAALGADAGVQWLELDYASEVPIEAVRVFENHNPGAVVKHRGPRQRRPVVIWQGEAPKKPEPHVFEAAAQAKATARRIRITLDTNKIPGWNEIDAVELIGRDGSRQWATSAQASSTYASVGGGNGPLVELQGKNVLMRVGGETLRGVLGAQSNGFVQIEANGRLLYVNPAQIAWIAAE